MYKCERVAVVLYLRTHYLKHMSLLMCAYNRLVFITKVCICIYNTENVNSVNVFICLSRCEDINLL